jgi:hypothetical protein
MLRFIKIVFIIIIVGAVLKTFTHRAAEKHADDEIPKLVASEQAKLPRMITKELRMDNLTYENRTLRVDVATLVTIEYSSSDKAKLQELMRTNYCQNMKAFWQSNVGIEYALQIPPRSISDHLTTFTIAVQPTDCPST